MALLLAEGFGWLPTTSPDGGLDNTSYLTGGQWAGGGTNFGVIDHATGRKGVTCLYSGGSVFSPYVASYSWADQSRIVMGVRLVTKASARDATLAVFRHSSGDILGMWGTLSSGHLAYCNYNDLASTYSVLTSTSSISIPGEVYCEIDVTFSNTTGSVTIWINGIQSGQITSTDTIYSGTSETLCNFINILGRGQAYDCFYANGPTNSDYIADLYLDTTTRHGDCKIVTSMPNADGADTDFSLSGGSDHYALVDEIGRDDDTTYIQTDAGLERDSFTFPTPSNLQTIKALVHQASTKRVDPHDGTIKIGAKHSASESQSADKAFAGAYTEIAEIFETNPSTASAWQESELATTELTLENTS